MGSTYKAVEVSAPGILHVVERPISEPGAGQVRIRVEACGICHTDVATVMGIYPGLTLPRVPGHEVVGRIDALGSGVSKWKIGQRVGVGLIAGEDGVCEPCRRGDMANPPKSQNAQGLSTEIRAHCFCQPPDRTELLSVTICLAEAKISAQVNSIVGSDLYPV